MRITLKEEAMVDMRDIASLLKEVIKPVVLDKIYQTELATEGPADDMIVQEVLRTQQYRVAVSAIVDAEIDSLVVLLARCTKDLIDNQGGI